MPACASASYPTQPVSYPAASKELIHSLGEYTAERTPQGFGFQKRLEI